MLKQNLLIFNSVSGQYRGEYHETDRIRELLTRQVMEPVPFLNDSIAKMQGKLV